MSQGGAHGRVFIQILSQPCMSFIQSKILSQVSMPTQAIGICTVSAYRPMLAEFLYSDQVRTIQGWPIVKLSISSSPTISRITHMKLWLIELPSLDACRKLGHSFAIFLYHLGSEI